jgi:ribonuclease HIII
MQTVLTLNNLAPLKTAYAAFLTPSHQPHVAWVAKLPQVTITAYRSGKVLFQGRDHAKEAQRWDNSSTANRTPVQTVKGDRLPENFSQLSVIGSDEVGAGAYFGPLTTAAVYVPADQIEWVTQLGMTDSKKLTDQHINQMAEQIIQRLPHHVVNLMPKKYNQLQQQYNVVALKALSHNLALRELRAKLATEPDAYLIDQFAQRQTYYKYLANQHPIIQENVYFSTKAETLHVAVAAASILARYVELQSMQTLSEQVGVTLPIGAGANVDRIAADLLAQGVNLADYAKVHFANTQKAQQLRQNKNT